METRTFSGSPFEIGTQIGAYYRACRVDFPAPAQRDLLSKQLAYYESFAPEVLDEVKGIADGSGASFESVAHAYLISEILYLRAHGHKGCSIGGFKDLAGDLWVARNYDWHPAVARVMQAWTFKGKERHVLALSDMGILGEDGLDKSKQLFLYEDALNSDGLFIGVTFAFCWNEGIGLTSFDAVRLAAQRCKTVAEALRFFEKANLSSAKNFFIADAKGNAAVIHHAVTSFEVRYPDTEGLLGLTNHYVGSLEKADEIHAADPNGAVKSFPRYARLMDEMHGAKANPVQFEALDRMMTRKDSPLSSCIAAPEIETVWTLLMNMPAKEYRLITKPRSPARAIHELSLQEF